MPIKGCENCGRTHWGSALVELEEVGQLTRCHPCAESYRDGLRHIAEDSPNPAVGLAVRLREAQDAIFDATVRGPSNWIRVGLPLDSAKAAAKIKEFTKLFGFPPTTVWDDLAIWEAGPPAPTYGKDTEATGGNRES